MMTRRDAIQQKICVVTLDSLMPKDHYLRDVDRLVDFSFIYDLMAPLYSAVGAPSLDPVLVIKMLLLGFMEGIDSERKLCEQIRVNYAYRWFLCLDIGDPTPEHSAFSQLRRRKFKGTKIFEQIFSNIVKQCIEYGLIDGRLLMTDSTHVRANASNKEHLRVVVVEETPSDYINRLNARAEMEGIYPEQRQKKEKEIPEINEAYAEAAEKDAEWQAEANAKLEAGAKLKDVQKKLPEGKKYLLKSETDPDCGFMGRIGKPQGFHYLSHQTTDALFGLITDVYVTPGNVTDESVHSARIKAQIRKYGFRPFGICADSGYDYSEIHRDMLLRGIRTFIPERKRGNDEEGKFTTTDFCYDRTKNICICPNGQQLHFIGYDPQRGSKHYISKAEVCADCPFRLQCIQGKLPYKQVNRTTDYWAMEEQHAMNNGTPAYWAAMRKRKIQCEGNFAIQKAGHNLTRMRKRGLGNAFEHCLLSATALNVRRMVRILTNPGRPPEVAASSTAA